MKRRRLELPRHNWHYPLKVARLPIPPPLRLYFPYKKEAFPELYPENEGAQDRTRTCTSLDTRTWNVRVYQFRHLGKYALQFLVCSINGAENGTRTRDPNLGKVVLYQLSYFRIFLLSLVLVRSSLDKHFSKCDAKVRLFSETAKLFPFFFHQNHLFLILLDFYQSILYSFHKNYAIFDNLPHNDRYWHFNDIPRLFKNNSKRHSFILIRCKRNA